MNKPKEYQHDNILLFFHDVPSGGITDWCHLVLPFFDHRKRHILQYDARRLFHEDGVVHFPLAGDVWVGPHIITLTCDALMNQWQSKNKNLPMG